MNLNFKLLINGGINVNFAKSIERCSQSVNILGQGINNLNSASSKLPALSNNLGSANDGFGKFIDFKAIQGASNSLLTFGKSIINTASKFEAGMSKVQAITNSDANAMKLLTQQAKELGRTTKFSASQAADAMSFLGMAGWNTEQIMKGMPGLLSLAAAGGTDLARTADIVSDNLTAFGLAAGQAGHMADVYAMISTKTNTNVEMLGETMKYAAPVAHAFGASMEETAALAGIMANSGIKASQAGTALRAGFLRLAGPPKMASKAMAELGMSMRDLSAEQKEATMAMASLGIAMSDTNGPRKMSAILTELRVKTKSLGEEQKLASLKAIFGTEAATGWLAVLNSGDGVFEKLVGELEKSDGAADKMAKTMTNNAQGAMIQLKSATEGLEISLGNILLPTIADGAQKLAEIASRTAEFTEKFPGLTSAALYGVGAFTLLTGAWWACSVIGGPVISLWNAGVAALTWLKNAQLLATAAQWAMNTAILGCPVVVLAAGFATAAYIIYKEWDKISAWFHTFFDWIGNKFAWLGDKVKGFSQWASKPLFGNDNTLKIAQNASGGIYGKGAFLTTFAENSGESAIPHAPTTRNIGLLARTNEIMGNPLGGGSIQATFAPQITITGNGGGVEEINTLMTNKMREFEEMLKRLQAQGRRLSYA